MKIRGQLYSLFIRYNGMVASSRCKEGREIVEAIKTQTGKLSALRLGNSALLEW